MVSVQKPVAMYQLNMSVGNRVRNRHQSKLSTFFTFCFRIASLWPKSVLSNALRRTFCLQKIVSAFLPLPRVLAGSSGRKDTLVESAPESASPNIPPIFFPYFFSNFSCFFFLQFCCDLLAKSDLYCSG